MLLRAIRYFVREIRMRRDPVAFARSLGVKVGEGCKFYAIAVDMFGSDPFLIAIGNKVHITNGVKFITHDGGTLIFREKYPDLDVSAPIVIGSNVYLGTCCLILPGVKIGNDCVVAAGAIVTRDVPDGSLVAGVPAKVIKSVDEYLMSLQKKSIGCGNLSAEAKIDFLKSHYQVH